MSTNIYYGIKKIESLCELSTFCQQNRKKEKKKCKTKGNTHFRPSSAPVFLHHRGLCFGWKTVDCDGNVGVFEHLLQNHRHSPPLQSIQATADAVDEKVGKKKKHFF